MIPDEWRYILQTNTGHVNSYGEVKQDGVKLLPYEDNRGNLRVDMRVNTGRFDYEAMDWIREDESFFVWELVRDAWYRNWPDYGHPVFLDGDLTNCSVSNMRAGYYDRRTRTDTLCEIREADGYYVFDKRLRGRVEIVEMGMVVAGVAEAAEVVRGTKPGVSRVLSGVNSRHRGYSFRWV